MGLCNLQKDTLKGVGEELNPFDFFIEIYRIDEFFAKKDHIMKIEADKLKFNLKRVKPYFHFDGYLHIFLDKDQSLSKTHMYSSVIRLNLNLD